MTTHNSRSNRNGVHSVKHIGRDFDVSKADNIDEERMVKDKFIVYHDNEPVILPFHIKNHHVMLEGHCGMQEHELNCYRQYIGETLDKKNERKIGYRKKNECKNIEQIYNAKNTAPEEQLLYLGKASQHVDQETLLKVFLVYQAELTRFYGNNIKFLTAALHVDEKGAPHIHFRRIYLGMDKDGIYISQNKALKEMGFNRSNIESQNTKWNNAKVTFTAYERQMQIRIGMKFGVEIETKPLKPGKKSQELYEHLAEVAEERQRVAEERQAVALEHYGDIQSKIASAEDTLEGIRSDTELAEGQRRAIKDSILDIEHELDMKTTLSKSTIQKLTKPGWFARKKDKSVPQLSSYECNQVREYLSRCFNLEMERKKFEKEKAEQEAIIEQRIKDRLPEEYKYAKEDAEYVREWIDYASEVGIREQLVSEREKKIDEREKGIENEVNLRLENKFNELLSALNERFIAKPFRLIKKILMKILPDRLWERATKVAEDELKAEMRAEVDRQMEKDDELQR